jgi:hypothetical protein
MKKYFLFICLTLCFAVATSAQNVGIGTTTPLQRLHVKGIARIDAAGATSGDAILSMYSGSTNDQSYIYFYNQLSAVTPRAYFGYSAPSDYSVWSRGNTTLYLKDGGLGVSQTDPLTKLHIAGGQDAGFGATANGYIMNGLTTGVNLLIDNNEILVRNNGLQADLLLQHDSGNVVLCGLERGAVGIGVTSGASIPAGFLLAVDGKIISEEVKVQLSGNWPDYVFNNNYPLRSFDELRNYIALNKHLPNIPAAAEVEKNGIEVGDMQKRMMEKIEELTLYILELEKKIKDLEKKTEKIVIAKN